MIAMRRALVISAALVTMLAVGAPVAEAHHKCRGKNPPKRCKGKGHGKPKPPVPPAEPGPYEGGPAELQPVGFTPLTSEEAAARVVRNGYEPRPENDEENSRVPTPEELTFFHANSDMPNHQHVDGQFTGTTDEIIQWTAHKWGLPEDVLRAVAVVESWWDMDTVGDNGDSFGIYQVRRPYHCCLPFMRDSTAFNADYYGGIVRAYFDGKQAWLNNPDVSPENGQRYASGDLWGSLGAWFDGRWHTPRNEEYVGRIRWRLEERTWATDPWFASHR
jgi:hypothetical protein